MNLPPPPPLLQPPRHTSASVPASASTTPSLRSTRHLSLGTTRLSFSTHVNANDDGVVAGGGKARVVHPGRQTAAGALKVNRGALSSAIDATIAPESRQGPPYQRSPSGLTLGLVPEPASYHTSSTSCSPCLLDPLLTRSTLLAPSSL